MVRYLADTNVLISLMRNERLVVQRFLESQSILIPFVALGELHLGARNSSRVEENLARINTMANTYPVLFPDIETTGIYGLIRQELKLTGHPIPEADIWIAALTRQHGLCLVTRDDHFKYVA